MCCGLFRRLPICLVDSRAFRYCSVECASSIRGLSDIIPLILYVIRGRSIYVKGYSRIDSIGRCLHAVYIDLKDLSIKGWTVSVTVVFRGGKAI